MELKRIVARDARSAHERAMSLYGRDALVIATAQIDGQTELVVAVEPSPSPTMTAATAAAAATFVPADGSADTHPAGSPFQAAMEAVMHLRQAAAAQADAPLVAPARAEPAPATSRPQPAAALRTAPATGFTPLAPAPLADTTAAEALRGREIVELVRREIAQLRAEFLAVQRQGRHRTPTLAPEVEAIAQALLDDGVPGPLRERLVAAIADCGTATEALEAMHLSLLEAMPAPRLPSWQGVHALLGPSGAGKTLMTARLALDLARRHGADAIAWISYGETRAAAWSEVQVLAAQAGVEAFRARDTATLGLLLEELGGRATILIDTPGTDFVRLAATLAGDFPQIALHALISADASGGSLQRLTGAPGVRWQSLLIAKTDEAVQPWPLIQTLLDRPDWQVSATADGDRLAGSLHAFSPEELLAVVLAPLADAATAAVAPVAPPQPPPAPAWTPHRALHA
jgi:flagellar biosynthesis protein FlhF